MQWLQQHDFPGNIRELEAMTYDAAAVATGPLLEAAESNLPLAFPPPVATNASSDGCVVEAIVHLEPSRLYADTRFLFVYVPEATQPALPPWSRATRPTVRCLDAA